LSSLANLNWLTGRNIVETTGGITTNGSVIASNGHLQLNGLDLTGSRAGSTHITLTLADSDMNLHISGASTTDNLFVTWTGNAANDTWDITSINWKNDADNDPIPFLDGDAVTFDTGGGSATIDIAGTQKTVAQMTVNGDNDLSINGKIVADNSGTQTTLTDSTLKGGLTKNGSGTLTLNGDGVFKGDATINGGTMEATGGVTAQALVMNNGTTFKLDGHGVFKDHVTLNGGTMEVTGSIAAPVLVMHNGTRFINGTAMSGDVDFGRLDAHGTADWQWPERRDTWIYRPARRWSRCSSNTATARVIPSMRSAMSPCMDTANSISSASACWGV